jgi:AraC family transcriptional regulator
LVRTERGALFGIGVYEYVQLARLKRASYELAFRGDRSVLQIALDAGYESPEAFARAFKKRFDQTPSSFRSEPEWTTWHQAYRAVRAIRMEHMTKAYTHEDVRIVDFEETAVAVVEHHGDPEQMEESVRRLIAWRREHRLPPKVSATFTILYTDPVTTPPEDFRQDLCAATTQEIAENPYGVVKKVLPGGRCARLRHIGSDDLLRATVHYLYYTWLPGSGEEPRDFPLFAQRVAFFPDVPEHETIIDVFLPLK